MIAALLLDFDGVLRRWPPDRVAAIERAAELPTGAIHAAAFRPGCLAPALRGEVSDDEWRALVAADLTAAHPAHPARAAAIPGAVAAWSAGAGEVDADVLALVRAARRSIPVALVSNATTRLPADLAQLGLTTELDAVISSAAVGVAKPHPAIFRAALAAVAVPAGAALFVDDDPRHVTAACSLGLRGHHFTSAAGLREILSDAGVLGASDD